MLDAELPESILFGRYLLKVALRARLRATGNALLDAPIEVAEMRVELLD